MFVPYIYIYIYICVCVCVFTLYIMQAGNCKRKTLRTNMATHYMAMARLPSPIQKPRCIQTSLLELPLRILHFLPVWTSPPVDYPYCSRRDPAPQQHLQHIEKMDTLSVQITIYIYIYIDTSSVCVCVCACVHAMLLSFRPKSLQPCRP